MKCVYMDLGVFQRRKKQKQKEKDLETHNYNFIFLLKRHFNISVFS